MTFADQVLKDAKCESDVILISEFHAVNVDFHSNKTEYFFADDSSIVVLN